MRPDTNAAATVIIPTHDHVETLRASVASVQRQSFGDLDIVVIGDGAPPASREIVDGIAASDPRVRYLDHPKSARHGEPYRDAVIRASASPFVFYQSDDDLWLPWHVETLLPALQEADFVHSLHVMVEVDASVTGLLCNVGSPAIRDMLRRRRANGFGLPFAAHRRDAYLRLSAGWDTTPPGCWTDLQMWSRWAASAARMRSLLQPTVLHFPSPFRAGLDSRARVAELQRWAPRAEARGFRAWLAGQVDLEPSPLLRALAGEWPDSPDALLALHRIALGDSERPFDPGPAAASDACALVLDPGQSEALRALLAAGLGLPTPEPALDYWQRLHALRPGDSRILARVCAGLARAGRPGEALQLLAARGARGLLPSALLARQAQLLGSNGDPDAAEALLREGLQRAPLDRALCRALTALLHARGAVAEARSVYEQALARDRKLRHPLLQDHADLLLAIGVPAAAARQLEECLQLNPESSEAWTLLGRCRLALRDGPGAIEALLRALALRARSAPDTFQSLAAAHLACGHESDAMEAARQGLRWHPGHPELRRLAARP